MTATTPTISFEALYPWALQPRRVTIDHAGARERARLYREEFRYVRAERQPEFCAPWVLGQELGWRIDSPIDVLLTPLPQTEIDASGNAEEAVRAAGMSELWVRRETALALNRPPWLQLYQFRDGDTWQNTFVPNGRGTVEWRLGWKVSGCEDGALMLFPSEALVDLGVQIGVLTAPTLGRLGETGISIAVAPHRELSIARGQEIARILLLHPTSLKAR
jgi:hypothetical protein